MKNSVRNSKSHDQIRSHRTRFEERFRELIGFLDAVVRMVQTEPDLSVGTTGGDMVTIQSEFWDRRERHEAAGRISGHFRMYGDEYERARENLSPKEIKTLNDQAVWNVPPEFSSVPISRLAEVTPEKLRARMANYVQEAAAGPAWERNRPQRKRGDEYRVREVGLDKAGLDDALQDHDLLRVLEANDSREESRYELEALSQRASPQEAVILSACLDQIECDGELNMAQVAEELGLTRQRVSGALKRIRRK